MKRRKKAFTLIELQISALMMVAVLVATGVIFYFSLASIRYMHEAVSVYTNALAAMKLVTGEVMISNCYGSVPGNPGYSAPAPYNVQGAFYETNGYVHPGGSGLEALNAYTDMPHLNGSSLTFSADSYGNGLFLRQATQSSTALGIGASDIAGDFPSHEIVQIYMDVNPANPTTNSLYVEYVLGGVRKIADNVTRFDITPLAYNSLHVDLDVEGTLLDPLGGTARNRITLSKQITLRCAPARTPIPSGTSW